MLVNSVFAQNKQSSLKWDSDTISCNFDMLHKSDTIQFTFTNTGKWPLHISNCYSTDTVLTVLSYTEGAIESGGTGYIKVKCTPPFLLRWRPVSCPSGNKNVHSSFLAVLNVVSDAVPALQSLVVTGNTTTISCKGLLRGRPYSPTQPR